MPAKRINQFTDGGALQSTDILHLQRESGGIWKDYGITAQDLYGFQPELFIGTYTLQALDLAPSAVPAPPAGYAFLVIDAYVIYRPGSTNMGQNVFAFVQGCSTDSARAFYGAYKYAIHLFNGGPYDQAILGSDLILSISYPGASPIATDGSLEYHIQYLTIPLS